MSFKSSAAASKPLDIYSPSDRPYGLKYEDHIENFWKWVISLPKYENPWPDSTGKYANNQSEKDIFYLSGNGGGVSERRCKAPAGKGLLIPVMVVEVSDKEAKGAPPGKLKKIAKDDQDSVTSMYLKINSKEYDTDDISKYRKSTGPFTVTFPKDPIFGATPGGSKAVADGHYIITHPLTEGETYNIHYASSLICSVKNGLGPNFAEDIKYEITTE